MPDKKTHRGEPWTLAESKQLGKTPDSVLAKRTGRTISALVSMREKLRIRLRTSPRRWTAREIKLLGHFTDSELSRRLRRDRNDVRRTRIQLGIAPIRPAPKSKPWTRDEEKLLGTMPDDELARRLKRTHNSVLLHRQRLGIANHYPKYKPWTPEQNRLLGTQPDHMIARLLGRKPDAVRARRQSLRIPPAPRHWPGAWITIPEVAPTEAGPPAGCMHQQTPPHDS